MNIFDRVVNAISPRAGVERLFYRQWLEEYKSYDAGNNSRLNRNWIATNQSAENTDKYDRDTIRARSRDLERNSDMANSVVSAFKRNVVGAGYTLRAQTGDKELNKSIEELWKKWCKANNCDVTGIQSFNQMMRMAVKRKKVDGGILFKKCYTRDGILPFKLQTIEVDELDVTNTMVHSPGNKLCGGIEYNPSNRPVGYWIKQYEIDNYQMNDPVYVEAKDIIFYFTKDRPSQVREMSDMSQSLTRIRDANEFISAVSIKERINACLAVFVKRSLPQMSGMGRGMGQKTEAGQIDYRGKRLSPGMIQTLNAGDEVQVVNPSGQGQDATTMTKLFQRLIGAGQGLSYEATSRDMSQTNYSSAREGRIEDDETYIEDIELLIEKVFDEVYETFVISAVLSMKIDIPDFWNNKEKYFEHEWIRKPKPWVDPQKEANANRIAMSSGQKTFKQICAENGRDYREQIDDMAEVLEYAREKGIELGGIIFGQTESELYEDKK